VTFVDPSLQRELDALAPPGLLIGHRLISPGDEDALLGEEAASIASTVVKARRASGAARIVARELLAQLGHPRAPLPKGASGAPVWPAGIAGSLAHDDEVAVAAVGRQRDVSSVGIDVEPAVLLPPDMLELIATPNERSKIAADPLRGKLLFAAKEAVYKAVYPLERVFLEFRDIEVDLAARKAVTRSGRVVALRYSLSPRVVVLALA
jgi:4'-phosphopantetheinyl transferase EntD